MKMPIPSALHSARPNTANFRPVSFASDSACAATMLGVIRLAGVFTRSRASITPAATASARAIPARNAARCAGSSPSTVNVSGSGFQSLGGFER